MGFGLFFTSCGDVVTLTRNYWGFIAKFEVCCLLHIIQAFYSQSRLTYYVEVMSFVINHLSQVSVNFWRFDFYEFLFLLSIFILLFIHFYCLHSFLYEYARNYWNKWTLTEFIKGAHRTPRWDRYSLLIYWYVKISIRLGNYFPQFKRNIYIITSVVSCHITAFSIYSTIT